MSEYLFDFYELLVENVFGSILLAIIGIGIIISVMLLIAKTRQTFFIVWITFYFTAMSALYFGGLGLVIFFLVGVVLCVWPLLRLIGGDR